MKKELALLIISIVLVLFSCKKLNNTITEEPAPSPTGSLAGFVTLNNEFGTVVNSNSSGVRVSLDSTSYSAITDSAGLYILKNIPANTAYNFTFSKSGFGSYYQSNYQFAVSGGTTPVFTQIGTNNNGSYKVDLYPESSTSIQSFNVISDASYLTFTTGLTNSNPAYTTSNTLGADIFISTQKNVSATNYDYSTSILTTSSNPTSASGTFYFVNSYPANTTVYCIAYGISGIPGLYGSSINPNMNTVPSTTVSIVTQ